MIDPFGRLGLSGEGMGRHRQFPRRHAVARKGFASAHPKLRMVLEDDLLLTGTQATLRTLSIKRRDEAHQPHTHTDQANARFPQSRCLRRKRVEGHGMFRRARVCMHTRPGASAAIEMLPLRRDFLYLENGVFRICDGRAYVVCHLIDKLLPPKWISPIIEYNPYMPKIKGNVILV